MCANDDANLIHQGVTLLLGHILRECSRKVKRQNHENAFQQRWSHLLHRELYYSWITQFEMVQNIKGTSMCNQTRTQGVTFLLDQVFETVPENRSVKGTDWRRYVQSDKHNLLHQGVTLSLCSHYSCMGSIKGIDTREYDPKVTHTFLPGRSRKKEKHPRKTC